MQNNINESQVEDYIRYNIQKAMEINGITIEEAVEGVRYYMDWLVNQVSNQMEGC